MSSFIIIIIIIIITILALSQIIVGTMEKV